MKVVLKASFLIVATIAIVVMVSYLMPDEKYSAETKEWLSMLEEHREKESDAFIYLAGIMAAESDSIEFIGRQRLDAFKVAAKIRDYMSEEKLEFADYPKSKWLPKPGKNDPLFCRLKEPECVKRLLDPAVNLLAAVKKHQTIIRRYRKYLSMSEYSMPILFDIDTLVDYSYITMGSHLQVLLALDSVKKNKVREGLRIVSENIEALRNQLTIADGLLHKMVFTVLITRNLDAIAFISSKYKTTMNSNILPLSKPELDMTLPILREYLLMDAWISKQLTAERTSDYYKSTGQWFYWLAKFSFKEKMTINEAVSKYKDYVKLSKMSSEDFAKYVIDDDKSSYLAWYNITGGLMNLGFGANYSKYTARLFDLDCKIRLVNYLVSGKSNLENPYYPKKPVDIGGDKICLDGPLKDEDGYRCIRTVW